MDGAVVTFGWLCRPSLRTIGCRLAQRAFNKWTGRYITGAMDRVLALATSNKSNLNVGADRSVSARIDQNPMSQNVI
jgi:hypothetical protein